MIRSECSHRVHCRLGHQCRDPETLSNMYVLASEWAMAPRDFDNPY